MIPMIPSNKLPPGFHPDGPPGSGGYNMEEYKEDSNMITFEVTENMLAKVSHHFPALPRLPCIKLIPKTIAHSGMIIYHDWGKNKNSEIQNSLQFLVKI